MVALQCSASPAGQHGHAISPIWNCPAPQRRQTVETENPILPTGRSTYLRLFNLNPHLEISRTTFPPASFVILSQHSLQLGISFFCSTFD